jgi:DNA gyrase subunit B
MSDITADVAPPENIPINGDGNYDQSNFQVLRDAEHIRKRPDMYIGNTGSQGLHHLVNELVSNSIDEALAGYCKNIHVRALSDGSLSVTDDGRGIPVEEHAIEKKPVLEVVMTVVGAGAKFDKNAYRVSAGLHGMGTKTVTALSEWSEAQVQRGGRTYTQEYERGKKITEITDIGPAKGTGTRITFRPDPEIFKGLTFDYDTLQNRLRELAFLNKGIVITLVDERIGKEEKFLCQNGLLDFINFVNRDDDTIHPPILIEKMHEDVMVEVAMQYTKGDLDRYRCYANNAFNVEGGTHLSGFRSAVTRTIGNYGKKENLFKTIEPENKDYAEGLTVIISVKVPDPKFNSQEKRRLQNPEVSGIVATVVNDVLGKYMEEHPAEAKQIIRKVVTAAEAREAAAKARKAIKDRKSILSGGGLPGKLYDCTSRNRDESELFLVEGDSAGGSAESGRERRIQAVLPLRGKPLNVEKSKLENLLRNEEITNLISAIGVDIGNAEDYESVLKRLRYARIIIMTDADVDGQHIRTLLLTFFYRQMAALVVNGHIYVARPPLYKVVKGKKTRFVQTAEQMTAELMAKGLDGTKLNILPPPGAGSNLAARVLEGEVLKGLLDLLGEIEISLTLLERAGLNLTKFLTLVTSVGLPTYRVVLMGRENWFFTTEEIEAFRARESQRLGRELVVASETTLRLDGGTGAAAQANNVAETLSVQEMYEVRKLNRYLERLSRLGLGAGDLVSVVQVAGREPAPRYLLENDEKKVSLDHLRDLVHEVRKIGERGQMVTRFKGLGEMDPMELWDTTLDPTRRILMQVQLDDAIKADEMFRTLMGDEVKPRRDFIVEHAMRIKKDEVDYHGA